MTRALIVADPQRDFCEGGSLGVTGGADVVSRIDKLLKSDHRYAYLIATRDHHIDPGSHFAAEPDFVDSWPPHCVVGSPGSEFHDSLTFCDFSAASTRASTHPRTARSKALQTTARNYRSGFGNAALISSMSAALRPTIAYAPLP
jgi:nicotinamidase-related amidase